MYDESPQQNPGSTHLIQNAQNEYIDLNMFYQRFKDQYENFNNLGFDLIAEYGHDLQLEDEVFEEFISYVDENYTGISIKEHIFNTPENIHIYSKLIYEILFIDMINKTLPRLMVALSLNSAKSLLTIDSNELKSELLKLTETQLKTIIDTSKLQEIENLEMIKIKLLFSIEEIYSGDFEDMYTNYFIPLINMQFENIEMHTVNF